MGVRENDKSIVMNVVNCIYGMRWCGFEKDLKEEKRKHTRDLKYVALIH